MIVTTDGWHSFLLPLDDDTRSLLERFDAPNIHAKHLTRLNTFDTAGDLVVFGTYDGHKQVNFEDQVGGHGSIGGDQLRPFLLAKKTWNFEMSAVTNSSDLYPMLVALRDRA